VSFFVALHSGYCQIEEALPKGLSLKCGNACVDRSALLKVKSSSLDPLGDETQTSSDLSNRLQAMVGFRNIAVHDYRKLSMDVVRAILENRLEDFRLFCGILLKQAIQ
jgi:uncharacterized protein YutE (UPF0331/DUF86 family)